MNQSMNRYQCIMGQIRFDVAILYALLDNFFMINVDSDGAGLSKAVCMSKSGSQASYNSLQKLAERMTIIIYITIKIMATRCTFTALAFCLCIAGIQQLSMIMFIPLCSSPH